MSLIKTINRTGWGRILVINSALIIFSVAIATQQFTSAPTQTVSKASPPPSPPPPNYPVNPPQITAAQPIFAKPGDAISLTGTNFGTHPWDSTLTLNQQTLGQTAITSWSDTRINLILPDSLPTNRLLPLQLTVNTRSTTTPIAVYDPAQTMEFALSEDRTTLSVRRPQPGSYVLIGLRPTTLTTTPTVIQNQADHTLYRLPLDQNTTTLLSASEPLTLTHLIPVTNPTATTIELPYYIRPDNPLISESQSLQITY